MVDVVGDDEVVVADGFKAVSASTLLDELSVHQKSLGKVVATFFFVSFAWSDLFNGKAARVRNSVKLNPDEFVCASAGVCFAVGHLCVLLSLGEIDSMLAFSPSGLVLMK